MIWFAIILAVIIGALVGLFTRDLKKALVAGFISLTAGVVLSLAIVYSGLMGG